MQNDLSIRVFQATDFGDKIGMLLMESDKAGTEDERLSDEQTSRRLRRLSMPRTDTRRFSMRVMTRDHHEIAFGKG